MTKAVIFKIGTIHKRRRNFSWFFGPSPLISNNIVFTMTLPKKDAVILKVPLSRYRLNHLKTLVKDYSSASNIE